MEGERDHRLHPVKMDCHHPVIVRAVIRGERRIRLRSSDVFVIRSDLLVRSPDRSKAAGLGRHHVDPDTEIHAEISNARTGEFHDSVLDKTVREGRCDQCDRDVMRADAVWDFAFDPYEHHLGLVDIPRVVQQLFDQLPAALADAHRPVASVAGVGI